MNKQGKTNLVAVLLVVALVIVAGYYYYTQTHIKTITEHAQPADISKGESGTGMSARFFDCGGRTTYSDEYCTVVEIPSWFSTTQGSVSNVGDFAIAKSPSPTPCPTGLKTECAGYATNPNIMCWNLQCVLGNLDLLALDYSITNTGAQGIVFNNVQVYSARPEIFNSSVNKSIVNGLGPGQTATFKMANINTMPIAAWIGTNQTFVINASGVSNYDNTVYKASDQYILGFYNNPVGSLSINIVKVV
ncbi:MAG: hypothetical protein WC758_07790 [Candidatus Woesearchaeota archaeon]|jgi:hypothetical protein